MMAFIAVKAIFAAFMKENIFRGLFSDAHSDTVLQASFTYGSGKSKISSHGIDLQLTF